MITYNDIKKWFEGESYFLATVDTSNEFSEARDLVLKFLMDHDGADLEATFTMHEIELKKEMDKRSFTIKKNMPLNKNDVIRGTRASFGLLDDYREHNADDINNIIVPLLEVPPLTEERITELVNAVNNARTHSF